MWGRGPSDIYDAIFFNNIEALTTYIETRTVEELSARNEGAYYTPLELSCRYGHVGCIKLLLNAKVDLGRALHVTTQKAGKQTITILNLLITHGADVNALDKQGYTPLIYACYKNSISAAYTLLKAGAKLNVVANQYTPLGIAIRDDYRPLTEYLLDVGAHIPNKVIMPLWVQEIVGKRQRFKKSYMVMYGVIRRRVVAGRDMTRVVADMVYSSRFDDSWLNGISDKKHKL